MIAASPWLSDDEVRDLCAPLVQPAAQRRFLAEQLKLYVRSKKNGRPLIARTELERVLGAQGPEVGQHFCQIGLHRPAPFPFRG